MGNWAIKQNKERKNEKKQKNKKTIKPIDSFLIKFHVLQVMS